MPDEEQSRIDPEEALEEELHGKWLDKKHDSLKLAAIYENIGQQTRGERVQQCGSVLQFLPPVDPDEKPRLIFANFCRDRLCPLCNWRRTMKIFGQVSQIMEIIGRDHRFIFCTLTVRNCSGKELPGVIGQMQKAWNRLLTYKDMRPFKGAFKALEITRHPEYPRELEYHPHFHIIFAVKPSYFTDSKYYLRTDRMVELWSKAMRLDYNPVCDLRTVKPKDTEKYEGEPGELAEKSAVAEVAKYAVKSADYLRGRFSDVQRAVADFLRALDGRRLCSFSGVFKEAKQKLGLDDETDGDLIHTDPAEKLRADVQYMLMEYRWRVGFGYTLEFVRPYIRKEKKEK